MSSPAQQPTDAQKKKPFDLLEHQAKVATTERPVYAQKKNGVQMSAEAKKAAKAKRISEEATAAEDYAK